jgi:hypothetical protein
VWPVHSPSFGKLYFCVGLLFKDYLLSYYLLLKLVHVNFKRYCLLALPQASTLWSGEDVWAAVGVVRYNHLKDSSDKMRTWNIIKNVIGKVCTSEHMPPPLFYKRNLY